MNLKGLATQLQAKADALKRAGKYDPDKEPIMIQGPPGGEVKYGGRNLVFEIGPVLRSARQQGAFDNLSDVGLLIDAHSSDPKMLESVFRNLQSKGFDLYGVQRDRGAVERFADAFAALDTTDNGNANSPSGDKSISGLLTAMEQIALRLAASGITKSLKTSANLALSSAIELNQKYYEQVPIPENARSKYAPGVNVRQQLRADISDDDRQQYEALVQAAQSLAPIAGINARGIDPAPVLAKAIAALKLLGEALPENVRDNSDSIPTTTNAEAAELLKIAPGEVTRLCQAGTLKTNGEKRKSLRISPLSIREYQQSDTYKKLINRRAKVSPGASTLRRQTPAAPKNTFVECIDCGKFVTAVNGVCPHGGNHALKPTRAKTS